MIGSSFSNMHVLVITGDHGSFAHLCVESQNSKESERIACNPIFLIQPYSILNT